MKLKPWQRPISTESTNGTLTAAQHKELAKRKNHPVTWAPSVHHSFGMASTARYNGGKVSVKTVISDGSPEVF